MLSAKDYVAIDDVTAALAAIAERGRARLYNVAAGVNVTHDAIAATLGRARGWSFGVAEGAPSFRFPRIYVGRLRAEFGAPQRALLAELPGLSVLQRQEVAC
jgi:nucleoside-diphosphate-sugar epimerase